jgi:hypothetical protein
LLESLREAVFAGEIHSPEEAIELAAAEASSRN